MIDPNATVSRQSATTSLSLLERAKANDSIAWLRLCDLYSPLICQWCRAGGVREADVPDVVQSVFVAVLRGLASFSREGPGRSFRGWLRTVTKHRIIDHHRGLRKVPEALGGSEIKQQLAEVSFDDGDPAVGASDEEELTILYRKALLLVQNEFPDWYKEAFFRVVVSEEDVAVVAQELGRLPSAIYNMKARVLRRLREEFAEVIE